MRHKQFLPKRSSLIGAAVLLVYALVLAPAMGAQVTFTTLYSFDGRDGQGPESSLIFDPAGNFYGTTNAGGIFGYGTVFELTPNAGGWTETVLHNFYASDGRSPLAGLVLDGAGNLYGTTFFGGAYGYGTVFELSPQAGGHWTERVLHSFRATDGYGPAGLIFDSAGNLYGTAAGGGLHDHGIVFMLKLGSGGKWSERILHNFAVNGIDGTDPSAPLNFDDAGNLYGTTTYGGTYGCGTVFVLSPKSTGDWAERIAHTFSGNKGKDGCYPASGVVFDTTGNLYGTTYFGGLGQGYSAGVVFKLSPTANGDWNETVLHSFVGGEDGIGPSAGNLVLDIDGNIYGATFLGGGNLGGTVFELKLTSRGGWTEVVLYAFPDGSGPSAGLIFDSAGNLYGTASGGPGLVFKITP